MALFDANKACSYDEILDILKAKKAIKGEVPYNTLRTSMFTLGKALDKHQHPLELKTFERKFQLVPRKIKANSFVLNSDEQAFPILFLDSQAVNLEKIARELIEKATLPFNALYYLEWSARWWEIFSSSEAQIRAPYEANAWEKLSIKNRLLSKCSDLLGFVSLAPGEGLAEIALLKKILDQEKRVTIHYLAIDSSPRLLRDHINLLKEAFSEEVEKGRIVCAGIVSDIYSGLRDIISLVRNEFNVRSILKDKFLPDTCGLLVTYLGNCLGNNAQDQESEIFSSIHCAFQNRPLEFLVGVSVMRNTPDKYSRSVDDFLLQTPQYLLATKKLLESSRPGDAISMPEFSLPKEVISDHCPPVVPEPYVARYNIQGQIYRFYYRLAYGLKIASAIDANLRPLPKGTLILLYNIVKYNIKTLVAGIEKCGLFKVEYNENYHQIVDTPNGTREYAVFSAYSE